MDLRRDVNARRNGVDAEYAPADRRARTLDTLLGIWTGRTARPQTVAAAYEQSLLYGEHTWGFDGKRFPRGYGSQWEADRAAGKFARLEASWGEHRDYARRAAGFVAPELEQGLKALSAAAPVSGKRIAVFNPLPWARSGVVETALEGPPPRALKDAATGALVPLEAGDGKLRFVARDVPPLGYRAYAFADGAAPAKSSLRSDEKRRTIENEFFRVTLDPARGGIASLFDKTSGRELAEPGDAAFGQYIHERFSAADMTRFVKTYTKPTSSAIWGDFGKPDMPQDGKHGMASPRDLTLRITRGAVSATALMEARASRELPYGIALIVSLYDGQPFVEIGWRITGKPETPLPEGGWLAFPLRIASPRFRLSRLGSVIDPASDTVRGSNHDVYCINGGVAVLDAQQSGAGLVPLDSPLISLDHPGLWQYTPEFLPSRPRVFVNLFNNLMGTNFAQWNGGSWTSRVRVWSIGAYESFAALERPSLEARSPLRGAVAEGAAGRLPHSRPGLRISREGVTVTAFGPNPDGEGLVLRLWEQSGRDGSAEVCMPEALEARLVQPVDLRGRSLGEKLSMRGGCFTMALRRYAPAPFLLR